VVFHKEIFMAEGFNQYLQAIRETRQLDAQKYAIEKVRRQETAQGIFQALNAVKGIGEKIAMDERLRNQYQAIAKEVGVFKPQEWGGKTDREQSITKDLEGMTKDQMNIIDRMAVLENKIPKNGPRDEKEARDIDYTRKKLDVLKRVLTEKDRDIMEKNNFLNQYRQSPQYQTEYENDAFKKFYKNSPLYSPKYFETTRQRKADPMDIYERKKQIDQQYKQMSGNGNSSDKAFSQIKYLKDEYDNISKDYSIDDEAKVGKQTQLIEQMENIMQQPGLSQIDVATGRAVMPNRPKRVESVNLVIEPEIVKDIEPKDVERLKSAAKAKWGVSTKDIDKVMKGEALSDESKMETVKQMIALYLQKKMQLRTAEEEKAKEREAFFNKFNK